MDPIQKLARRLRGVEKLAFRAATQPQLAHSSIEDGAIQAVEDGTLKAIIGKQFDGTTAVAIVNGPPPPQPSMPGATAALEGAIISWDGTFMDNAIVPMDFARVEVHVSTDPDFTAEFAATLKATFETPRGGQTFVSLVPSTYYVKLVARNSSGGRSIVSPTATVVPQSIADAVPGMGTDGDAPATSPTPSVQGGIKSLFVGWDPVDNADPVTYEVHVSTTSGFTPDSTTLSGETPGTLHVIRTLPGDAARLSSSTLYYVRVIAKDADGAAAPSPEIAASPNTVETVDIAPGSITATEIGDNAVTAAKIFAEAVTSDKIAANAIKAVHVDAEAISTEALASDAVTADKIKSHAVTADALEALLVLATTIQVGGPNFTIDPVNGIKINLPSGGYISMPANGLNAEFRKVILDATDLLVEDNFELRGASNRISGTLKMSTGVDTPTTGPGLSAQWAAPDFSVVGSAYYRGLYDNGTTWMTAYGSGTAPTSNAAIMSIDKTTGATSTLKAASDLGLNNTTQQIVDFTVMGSSRFLLVSAYGSGTGDTVVREYDNTWAFVREWKVPTISGRAPVLLSNDGVDIFLGYRSTTSSDLSVRIVRIPSLGSSGRTNMVTNPNFEVDASQWNLGLRTGLTRSNTVGGQVGSYAGRIESLPTRTNLMPNPLVSAYAAGTTGWGAGSNTNNIGWSGSYLFATTVTNTSTMIFYANAPWSAVTPGVSYTVALDLVGSTNINGFGILRRWLDAGGNIINEADYSFTATAQRRSVQVGAAPANAAYLAIYPHGTKPSGINSFSQINIANVYVGATSENDSSVIPAGSDSYWTGTAGNSPTVYHPAIDTYVYTQYMAVEAGKSYAASVYARGSVASNIIPRIYWYDASNNYLGESVTGGTPDTTTGFTRFSQIGTAPAGATKALFVIYAMGVARGDYHYIDAALFEQSSSVGTYFDGDTSSPTLLHSWIGTPGASASEEMTAAIQFTTEPSTVPISNPPTNLWVGTGDLGAKHFVISSPGGTGIWDNTGFRGSDQIGMEWGAVAGAPTIGLAWDGASNSFKALTYTAAGAGSFTSKLYPLGKGGISSRAISARYSQYDSNSTGGTHETAWSNPSTLTLPPRQQLKVVTPAPQGTGAADEPNSIRHYIQVGGSGSYYRQADVTASPWSATYDSIPTTGATATSTPDFAGLGNPGVIQSAKVDANGFPIWSLRGDGVIHMFPGEVRAHAGINAPLGTLKCDGTSYLRSLYTQLFNEITFTKVTDAASHPSGINTIYIADTSNIAVGMQVEGNGIPQGTTVTAITPNTQITISANTTAAIAGAVVRFLPHGAVDTTHFNVPDYRGCTLVGADGTPEFLYVGKKYGTKTNDLTHQHYVDHTHNGVDHLHGIFLSSAYAGSGSRTASNASATQGADRSLTTGTMNGRQYTDGPASSMAATNNIQPSASVNWIIAW